eukprot:185154-Hanusia_phi.AAC.6
MVRVDLDKPGYSHYEWKTQDTESARKNGRRAEVSAKAMQKQCLLTPEQEKAGKNLGGLAGVIEQRLDKIEHAHYAMTPREPLQSEERRVLPLTICSLCLGDAERDIRNRPLVQRIKQLRSTKF